MFKSKKSLGQNFLRSEKALAQIVEAAELKSEDVVLEIGPGQGALTEKLLATARIVLAVEKDEELVAFLKDKFKKEISEKKLILINEDILKFKFTPSFLLPLNKGEAGWGAKSYKLVANIPYNITGEIFRKFLQEEKVQPERMVLLVQKEVAERIVGSTKYEKLRKYEQIQNSVERKKLFVDSDKFVLNPSGRTRVGSDRSLKESILSISVKVYGEPKYIDTVRRGSFTPVPKVDSAILLIENISRKRFLVNNVTEEDFFKIVKTGFAHKRKLLSSNLKPLLGNEVSGFLKECMINEKARAEELKVEDWLCLATLQGEPRALASY